MSEPLLQPIGNKYVFNTLLNEYSDVMEMYKKQQGCFWTTPEIDMSMDRARFAEMTPQEKHFFSHILAFFACGDGLVSDNISSNFLQDCQVPVVQCCYAWQNAMEFIHGETYSQLLDTLIPNTEEKERLFNAIETIPVIKQKIDFGKKYLECNCEFRYRVVAFIIFEGIFFSGSFAAIFWNKSKPGHKQLPGLITANEFIARDEGLHCEFGCMLYKKLQRKLTQNEIHRMFRKAVDIEKQFITDSLPCSLIGMNAEAMSQYIEFVADYWLKHLEYQPTYNTPNPFPFMEAISLESKTNFFEQRVTQYQKSETAHTFTLEEDF